MTGRYCPKHEEWCPSGECRWCEPEPVKVLPMPEVPSFAKAAQAMIDAAKARIYAGWMQGGPIVAVPPTVNCYCGRVVLHGHSDVYDEPARHIRHTASFCGPLAAHMARAQSAPVLYHHATCPMAGFNLDPAQALAAGCTCVPSP